MSHSDKTQEQILAKLTSVEAYLARIASAVTLIAQTQRAGYDVHLYARPTTDAAPPPPAAIPDWLGPAATPATSIGGGLTEMFRRPEAPVVPSSPVGSGEATRILNAPAPEAARPATPEREPGEFTKYFPSSAPAASPIQPEPDDFDATFGPKWKHGNG